VLQHIVYHLLTYLFAQGLFEIGSLKAGETLVVSGAAGAVGSIVCQLGKIKGARVIGIAGSEEKVAWLENELGIDKGLNYKSPTFVSDFKEHVGYLDVYFDNGASHAPSVTPPLLSKYHSWRRDIGFVSDSPKEGCTYFSLWRHLCIQ
jgi:NADPH-dependent curcumin reductase CurA